MKQVHVHLIHFILKKPLLLKFPGYGYVHLSPYPPIPAL